MTSLTVEPTLLEKYATSAPRYTSYPTAVDWGGEFDPSSYPARLSRAATRTTEPLSVYLHIPFCQEMCLFCGCNVVITRKQEKVARYLDHLEHELEMIAASNMSERPVRQYHWGGGTPTQLSCEEIERVQRAFEKTFEFAPDAEMAIEVDPRVTTVDQVQTLAGLGWNRISMGVQDFDSTVQSAVKRVQSEEQTRLIVDAARKADMPSVNIDLMYGLPHQTRASFARTVETIVDIRPERIALFHYAHVPWMKRHQTALDVEAMPDPAEKIAIFIDTLGALQQAGYVYIGLDHFALPTDELAQAVAEKRLHRNFMGYTTLRGTEMVSLGQSAIGEVDGAFVQNAHNEADYLDGVAATGSAVFRGHELSPEDHLRRDVILSLMCNGEVDKQSIHESHGVDFDAHFADELQRLAPLEEDDLVERGADAIRLTSLGQLFMRNVAVEFDTYYANRRKRGEDGKRTFSKTL